LSYVSNNSDFSSQAK